MEVHSRYTNQDEHLRVEPAKPLLLVLAAAPMNVAFAQIQQARVVPSHFAVGRRAWGIGNGTQSRSGSSPELLFTESNPERHRQLEIGHRAAKRELERFAAEADQDPRSGRLSGASSGGSAMERLVTNLSSCSRNRTAPVLEPRPSRLFEDCAHNGCQF